MAERWTITLCPFLHFDNAKTHSYEHNISIVSWNVKSVLDFLEVDTAHKFCLDQVTLLEGFRRLFPNYWDSLSQRVLEGRIEIVGGTYVMPDFIIPDGESIVRQFEYGIDYFRKELGITIKTGWAIDSAGHCSQMPQILRQCGIDSYYFSRGMPYDAPTEFEWQGPDGSKVNAIWLKRGFTCAAWLSENTREAFSNLLSIINETGACSSSNNLFIPIGGELVPPPMHISDIVNQWNDVFPDSKADISIAREFSDKLKMVQSELPTISGELASGRFQGISSGGLSSRSKLKVLNRRLESLLYLAELYLALAGDSSHNQELANIWRMLLFNQEHNIIRGTISDDPYKLALRRYDQGIEMTEELLEKAISSVSCSISPQGSEPSIAVFNPSSWTRSDVVRVPVDRNALTSDCFILVDDNGSSIPYQIIDDSVDTNPIEVVFIAESVHSLGYRVFSIRSVQTAPEFDTELRVGKNWIESSDFIVEFDSFSGSLTRLYDKGLQSEFINQQGSHVILESDVGDLYRYVPSELSDSDSIIDSLRTPGKMRVIESGPVRATVEVSSALSRSSIVQRFTVYSKIRRLDIDLEIDFHELGKRMRYILPIPIYGERFSTGSQFVVEQKNHTCSCQSEYEDHGYGSFSALDWVDFQGPETGLGISAIGLHDFQYGDGEFGITVLRSPTHLSHGRDDEMMDTKTGRDNAVHSYRISLLPHKGNWSHGQVPRRCTEHRLPLIGFPLESSNPERDALPLRRFEIEDIDLDLSSYRPGKDDSEGIIRLFDLKGNSGMATLAFEHRVRSAFLTDFLGNEIGELQVHGKSVRVQIDPYSICTIKVRFESS